MSRRSVVSLAAYAVVVAPAYTSLYEPLIQGRDDSWAILVALVGAHIGLGAGVARGRALLPPVVLPVAGFVALGADGWAYLVPLVGVPVGLAATAFGWGLAAVSGTHRATVTVIAFAVSLVPVGWAVAETLERSVAPREPAEVQAQLPIKEGLGNLCPGASGPRLTRRVERRAEVMLRELRLHPGWLVEYTYRVADSEDETRVTLTVRELAEEQVRELKCAPALQRRIREAFG